MSTLVRCLPEKMSVHYQYQRLNCRLLEIAEQIRIPLATVFNLSLEEGVVPPFEWKEANIIPVFKKEMKKKVRNINQ